MLETALYGWSHTALSAPPTIELESLVLHLMFNVRFGKFYCHAGMSLRNNQKARNSQNCHCRVSFGFGVISEKKLMHMIMVFRSMMISVCVMCDVGLSLRFCVVFAV